MLIDVFEGVSNIIDTYDKCRKAVKTNKSKENYARYEGERERERKRVYMLKLRAGQQLMTTKISYFGQSNYMYKYTHIHIYIYYTNILYYTNINIYK